MKRAAAAFIALVALLVTLRAQSPHPFGVPTADQPQPGTTIKAVPGSRAQGWLSQGRSEVLARHGMVATSDPLAAEAGLEILRQGGNAIDAAVATGAVLDVTSQNDTGIGGDLFALVYVAKDKKLYALNSAGWAPSGWTPEFFTKKLGVDRVPNAGVNSATVPGATRTAISGSPGGWTTSSTYPATGCPPPRSNRPWSPTPRSPKPR